MIANRLKEFIIIGHKAVTTPFSMNDLAGAGGRMDILCRCVNAALFLSHDLRKNVRVYLVLKGGAPPRIVRFNGSSMKYLNPDERSAASLIRKSLEKQAHGFWTESTPGVSIRTGDFGDLLGELKKKITYLRENGADIRQNPFDKDSDLLFVLGDHIGLTDDEEALIMEQEHEIVSVGPLSLHAEHCIVLLQNEMDRAEKYI